MLESTKNDGKEKGMGEGEEKQQQKVSFFSRKKRGGKLSINLRKKEHKHGRTEPPSIVLLVSRTGETETASLL